MELQQSHDTHRLHDRLLQLHEVPCLPLYESVLDYIPHHHLLLPPAYLPLALAFYFVYTKWGAQIIMDMDTIQENHVLK